MSTHTGWPVDATICGRRVVAADSSAGGHTQAWSGRATLDDGATVFVKSASGDLAGPLRREAAVLEHLVRLGGR